MNHRLIAIFSEIQSKTPLITRPAPLRDNRGMNTPAQPRNPLHGLTLERLLNDLVDHYGWAGLNECIPLRCFSVDPSISSSLKFLRKTPWAREKVESLYLYTLRRQQRQDQGQRY